MSLDSSQESTDGEEHGVENGFYDNLQQDAVLQCLCGFAARGSNWAEAGAALDDHMEDL